MFIQQARVYRVSIVVLLLMFIVSGCESPKQKAGEPLLKLLHPRRTNIHFKNQIHSNRRLNAVSYEMIYNGAGVGVLDFNNDGRKDLLFASNMSRSKLYLNKGNMRFKDVTDKSGINTSNRWVNGVSIVDINNDNLPDIYLSCGGPYKKPGLRENQLYINNGDNTFSESSEQYGLSDSGYTTHAAFFDYDKDGDLDAYLLTNGVADKGPNVIHRQRGRGQGISTDKLYERTKSGFVNVSDSLGITIEGNGLGVAIFDANKDGWLDIYAANDYLSNDIIYVNKNGKEFTDKSTEYFKHQSYSSMGTDVADINNDGNFDIITLDMLPESNVRLMQMYETAGYQRNRSERKYGYDPQVTRNTLQLNNGLAPDGTPSFSEIGQLANVHATDWSWAPLLLDLNNDGWRDLFITNGIPIDVTNQDFSRYKNQVLEKHGYNQKARSLIYKRLSSIGSVRLTNVVFKNKTGVTFVDKSDDWGMHVKSYSTGAAYADLDNDGDLDIITNNINSKAFVYENKANKLENNYLSVNLVESNDTTSTIGAHVTVYTSSGDEIHKRLRVYRGYKSSVSRTLHFGLGHSKGVDSLVVEWPSDKKSSLTDVQVNSTVSVQKERQLRSTEIKRDTSVGEEVFTKLNNILKEPFKHKETHYNDFAIQPLLPRKHSQYGPGVAVGDVNNDTNNDFYVGGAFDQAGHLYIQNKNGVFNASTISSGTNFQEETGVLFFDANSDGNLDLYVASGGSEFKAGSKYYQDRLYRGDGTGQFSYARGALPTMNTSSSTVVAADYDRDGDKDLFVGSRVVPHEYPKAPQSYILENVHGTFRDSTSTVAPEIEHVGLVTAAVWTDYNNDAYQDLIIVGEWMPITVFKNKSGSLRNVTEKIGLANTVGWWNSINTADVDKDGYTEYLVGNLGTNTWLKNKPNKPVKIHTGDFNSDGKIEGIISRYAKGVRVPIHFRNDLISAIPQLKKTFPTFESYAKASVYDILQEIDKSVVNTKSIDTFKSSIIENKNGLSLSIQPLPIRAQFAPVYGSLSADYDCNGSPDVLLTGNSFASDAFTGPYDALRGLMLTASQDSFKMYRNSGFYLEGDGKALSSVVSNQKRLIIASRNNGELKVFKDKHGVCGQYVHANPSEMWAEVIFQGGGRRKVEFHYGSGYLSQSSHGLVVPETASKVVFRGPEGVSRVWRRGQGF